MYFFFTIPVFFVICIVLLVVSVGWSVLGFLAEHVVVITVLFWLPIVLFLLSVWKKHGEERMELTLFFLTQVPTYRILTKMIRYYAYNVGLAELIDIIVACPLILLIMLGVGAGAMALTQVIGNIFFDKNSVGILLLGIAVTAAVSAISWRLIL